MFGLLRVVVFGVVDKFLTRATENALDFKIYERSNHNMCNELHAVDRRLRTIVYGPYHIYDRQQWDRDSFLDMESPACISSCIMTLNEFTSGLKLTMTLLQPG